MSLGRFPYTLFCGRRRVYLELKPFLVLYCFFVLSFFFFCVRLSNRLHFRRIVVVCGDRTWIIPRHGVVFPCGVIHSWIFCVLIHSCNFRILIFLFWYVHLWIFSSSYGVATPGISSWYGVVTPGISAWLSYSSTPTRSPDSSSLSSSGVSPYGMGLPRRFKKNSRIMVVSLGKRMHTVNNARRDGDMGKGVLFIPASCKEVEEPMGTLEVSCWSEADSRFCAVFCGVAWKYFFVSLGVCAKLNFAVFFEINGGPCHERSRRNCAGHAAIYGGRVEPENSVSHHAGDHSVWEFFVGK